MQINGEILRGNAPRGTDHDLCPRGIHYLPRQGELGVAHPPRHEYYLPPRTCLLNLCTIFVVDVNPFLPGEKKNQ